MKTRWLLLTTLIPHITWAAAYKCQINGEIGYSDRPCPGGKEIQLDPAPVAPLSQPSRLIIKYQDSGSSRQYDLKALDRRYEISRQLDKRNSALTRLIIDARQHKEQELKNAAISHPERMSAINLYWDGKIHALEREYDINLMKLNQLRYRQIQPD